MLQAIRKRGTREEKEEEEKRKTKQKIYTGKRAVFVGVPKHVPVKQFINNIALGEGRTKQQQQQTRHFDGNVQL